MHAQTHTHATVTSFCMAALRLLAVRFPLLLAPILGAQQFQLAIIGDVELQQCGAFAQPLAIVRQAQRGAVRVCKVRRVDGDPFLKRAGST